MIPPHSSPGWAGLLAADARHVWHPYGPIPATSPPRPVVSAAGVRITLDGGRELIDGMASWWCAVHGYRHPVLDAAVTDQLGRMAHVMFGGLTHEPAIRLAERLVSITPEALQHVFFADSGSVSVEVAIKMALQFWRSQGRPQKARMLALRGGYHGDTFGAMALCDPVGGMHHLFADALPQHVFADRPPSIAAADADPALLDAHLAHVEALISRHAAGLAAVVVEPVLQGAGGMHAYPPAILRRIRELCDEHEVLLVADEIATGFGRTGARFGCDHADVTPDVMTLGKALTGGYMTLAATLCTTRVAEGITQGEAGALMHGPTFMANPLACSTALASLDLLERPASEGGTEWRRAVPRIETQLHSGLAEARTIPGVHDVRVLGAVGVVQLDHPVDVAAATAAAISQGVWLRPFRDLVYTMPPYVCEPYDVDRIIEGVLAAADAG
ncbi:adenosylmethionine--8-amino-7-oxononanoate transaminase [Paraconexibacter sp.]|uniref:adenosylmethionine--8-amino-7-oxononanoate transaminase n=1 Tax=Paraconexibacter sp. TaxID=2949640 RepID=UPI00356A443B